MITAGHAVTHANALHAIADRQHHAGSVAARYERQGRHFAPVDLRRPASPAIAGD